MGLFGRRKAEFPPWELRSEDFLADSLDNYTDPHLRSVLFELDDIIPDKWRHYVYVAGGFAAHLAGITREHSDIDIFCVTEEAFTALTPVVHNNKEVTDRRDTREFLDVQSGACAKVVKFKFRDFKFDLVDFHDRCVRPSVVGVLQGFDINWSMAGIDFYKNELVIHKEALSTTPKVSPERAEIYLQGTEARLPKYRDRLCREPDSQEVDRLIAITQAYIAMKEKQIDKGSWY